MREDERAVVADRLGVKYDLRLSQRRTLREAAWDLLHARRRREEEHAFWALRDVTFDLDTGEMLGVVGRNGSGKSTLLLAIAGIIRPDEGTVSAFGRTSTLLALGAGFEPQLTGRDNVYLNGAYLGYTRADMERRFDDIVQFSELGAFVDAPIRTYSTGMRARLGFSIAAHLEPDILLLDEILGVGDIGFQEKSAERLRELMARAKAIVVVSHSVPFLKETATKVLWLERGRVEAFGGPAEVLTRYETEAKRASGPVRVVA